MIKAVSFVGAIIAALLVAFILLAAVEVLSSIVHPFPADFANTMEDMHQHVARCPGWVLAVVVPVWGLIAFISTWIAKRIGSRGAGVVIALLLVAAVLFNVSSLPYAIWFKIASVVAVLFAVVVPIRPVSTAAGHLEVPASDRE